MAVRSSFSGAEETEVTLVDGVALADFTGRTKLKQARV